MITVARRLAAGVLAVAALSAAVPAGPAAAHGGTKVTLNSDGVGAVWVTVTADDGHPVEDPVEATVSARAEGGGTLSPVKMVQSSSPGTLVYMGVLAPGRWTVTVDLGPPVYRTCTAAFTIAQARRAESTPCDPPAAAASADPPAPTGGGTDRLAVWALVAAAAGGAAIAAVALITHRRRLHR